jgi:hypothetical protein
MASLIWFLGGGAKSMLQAMRWDRPDKRSAFRTTPIDDEERL